MRLPPTHTIHFIQPLPTRNQRHTGCPRLCCKETRPHGSPHGQRAHHDRHNAPRRLSLDLQRWARRKQRCSCNARAIAPATYRSARLGELFEREVGLGHICLVCSSSRDGRAADWPRHGELDVGLRIRISGFAVAQLASRAPTSSAGLLLHPLHVCSPARRPMSEPCTPRSLLCIWPPACRLRSRPWLWLTILVCLVCTFMKNHAFF